MDFWIEGKVRLYHEDYDTTTHIVNHLVKGSFPNAKSHNKDYHSTLLYIGGPHPTEEVVHVLRQSKVSHLYFLGINPSLMAGGEDYDQLLLKFESKDMVNTFKALYDNFTYAGIKPKHRLFGGGFTPHVTLAQFHSAEDCKAEIDTDNGLFVQQLLASGGDLVVGDFHLFGSDDVHDKVQIL